MQNFIKLSSAVHEYCYRVNREKLKLSNDAENNTAVASTAVKTIKKLQHTHIFLHSDLSSTKQWADHGNNCKPQH